jgi:hypothetical protein
MRTFAKKSVMLAVVLLGFAAGTANAAASDVLEVKVPFPFVVNGRNFPAGPYRVERSDASSSLLLIQGERGKRPATFVLTVPAVGHDPAGSAPALSFDHYENQNRLSTIWETGTEGLRVDRH